MAINRTFASFVEEAMLLQEQGEQEEYVYGYPGGYHESEDVVSYAEGPSVEERCALRLGYTCDNLLLKRTRKIHTSRGCIRKTFEEKGLAHVSQLALANCLDLLELIAWNHANGIHLYRMTSKLFPWAGHYELEELPQYELICAALSAAGDVARAADQRITNHPSHFIKLASSNESIIESSIKDLEVQSRVFDLMGYTPSHWNKVCVCVCVCVCGERKGDVLFSFGVYNPRLLYLYYVQINIHVGGVYGNKNRTLARFAETFHERLSDSLKARLAIENDDVPNSYSVDDLMILHSNTGIPITFDFHHHQFCPGTMSQKEAFETAMSTWPKDIRPVVHWSEMPECPQRRKTHPHSHSNFVYGPINVYGHEDNVDVMIESKGKEAALLLYRDKLHHLQRCA